MRKLILLEISVGIFCVLLLSFLSCTNQTENNSLSKEEMIERGKYLVDFGGCHDCHTPKVYTDMGPIPDTTRLLAGHFEGTVIPVGDVSMIGPDKWVMTEKNFTAWVGPWGISYSANLTPDNATGIGTLSEAMFIKTLREGKWMGVGRPLLPPMPWPGIGSVSDEDLKSIYAYLMSIKPINNTVPKPVSPDKMKEVLAIK